MAWSRRMVAALALAGLIGAPFSTPARAETAEVRILQLYGLIFLPVYVMADQKLVEKHAKAAGLGDLKVTVVRASSGAAAADYILSGSTDVAVSGNTTFLTIWDKTLRTNNKVRGMMAICDTPAYLITTDPRIKSLADFTDQDRIAVTAVKISLHALTLQMAAAKEFGWEQRFRLDPMTVSMSNPDGLAALLSGSSEVKSQVTVLPYNFYALASGKARLLMTSYDVLGGRSTGIVAYTTEAWKQENPKTYAVVAAALQEAIDIVNKDKELATDIYMRAEPSRTDRAEIRKMLDSEDDIAFTATPHKMQLLADFMHRVGTLRNNPASWKDMFFETVHVLDGS